MSLMTGSGNVPPFLEDKMCPRYKERFVGDQYLGFTGSSSVRMSLSCSFFDAAFVGVSESMLSSGLTPGCGRSPLEPKSTNASPSLPTPDISVLRLEDLEEDREGGNGMGGGASEESDLVY